MILIDTDTLTLYFNRHPRVSEKFLTAEEVPVTSIVTRIEVLQGRFESVLKAADAHHATLVTRNLRHFRKVPGLRLENWAD
jgi:predicted nucleic acid-binding protein